MKSCLVVVSVICFAVVRVRQVAVFKARVSVASVCSPVKLDGSGAIVGRCR